MGFPEVTGATVNGEGVVYRFYVPAVDNMFEVTVNGLSPIYDLSGDDVITGLDAWALSLKDAANIANTYQITSVVRDFQELTASATGTDVTLFP